MNWLQSLRIPWYSTHRSLRWLSVLLFVLCCSGAIAIGVFASGSRRWTGALTMYGFGLACLWAFFFSSSILLAIDTRQLRVPDIQRQVVRGLLLYGGLSIGVPLVVLSFTALPLVQGAVVLALFASVGLAFALMPRYVAIFIGLTPSLFVALWRHFKLPGMGDPHFAAWAVPIVLALLLANTLRWRQLLRNGSASAQGWSSPLVLQFRNGSWSYWGNLGDNRRLRQRPAWLQLEPDLDGVSPGAPRKTLRMALGGWYMPQTTHSYLRQLCLLVGSIALPALVITALTLTDDRHADVAAWMEGFLVGGLGSLAVIAGPMICLISLQWLGRRWGQASAELPLLALLPGLGDPGRIKRQLLRAGLGLPLWLHGLPAVSTVVAMLFWRSHEDLLLFMLLAQLGAGAVTVAAVLNLFGGRMLPHWMTALALIVFFVLTVLSVSLPTMAGDRPAMWWAASSLPWLGLAWLLLGGVMYWLGRRGWQGLAQRPHPFLTT